MIRKHFKCIVTLSCVREKYSGLSRSHPAVPLDADAVWLGVPGPPSIRLYLSPLWAVSVGQWVTSNQCTPAPITSPLSTLPCPVSSSQLTGLFSALLYLPPITCPAICLIKWETEKCLQSISADQVSAGCISSHIPYIVILQLAQSKYLHSSKTDNWDRAPTGNKLLEWVRFS